MDWPIEPGEYEVVDPKNSVAVVTMADDLAIDKTSLAVVGKVRTENLGVERIIVNTISNPNIRYVVVCGREIKGHKSGDALINVWKSGIDRNKRIVSAKGALPVIQNLPKKFVERFKEQVEIIDLLNEVDKEKIDGRIASLKTKPSFKGGKLDFKDYAVKEEHIAREIVPTGGGTVFVSQEYGVAVDAESGLVIESGA
jgi:tetrahydromethanopterin S-methyltransferase subunit A